VEVLRRFIGTYSLYFQGLTMRQESRKQYVRFEVFTAVTMKKAVFWDVALCRCGVNPSSVKKTGRNP
jgi:hypothetical protein